MKKLFSFCALSLASLAAGAAQTAETAVHHPDI